MDAVLSLGVRVGNETDKHSARMELMAFGLIHSLKCQLCATWTPKDEEETVWTVKMNRQSDEHYDGGFGGCGMRTPAIPAVMYEHSRPPTKC